MDRVYNRIDRCLANEDWLVKFSESYAHFWPEGWFDHCSITVQFGQIGSVWL